MAAGDLIVKRGPKLKPRFIPGPTYRKRCNVCGKRRLAKLFHKRSESFDGLAFTCKACVAVYGQERTRKETEERRAQAVPGSATYARWLAREHPEIYAQKLRQDRRRKTLKRYGISLEHYDQLFEKQGGLCAICENPERRVSRSGEVKPLVVDHDHETGRVRGLLCHDCNIALGLIEDNPEIAKAMVRYLKRGDRHRSG
jgi:CRISPR/Cas system-associated protein Cas10 (large subunit of type III CRISPR-Cas system)